MNGRNAGVAMVLFLLLTGCSGAGGVDDVAPVATATSAADAPCGTDAYDSAGLRVTYVCYDVSGNTAQEIRTSINAHPAHPADPTGARFDANTRWEFKLVWTFDTSGGGCRAKSIVTYLTITQTFPHWVPTDTDRSLQQEWSDYIVALRVHEDGHKQIALDAANDAIQRVRAQTVATCKEFDIAAQSAVEAATSLGKSRDEQYDDTTRHGATQGARFP